MESSPNETPPDEGELPVIDEVDDEVEEKFPRGLWQRNTEFVLSCIGFSVGLGNLWRFPYLAYENGGAAFIFTYFVMALFTGRALYFLDVALGQFCSKGTVLMWACCPIATGVGYSMIIGSTFISIYYNVLMVYCLYYCFQSFRAVLPWSDCMEWWGADENCYLRSAELKVCKHKITPALRKHAENISYGGINYVMRQENCTNATMTAAEMFWERYVLNLSSGISEPGNIRWELFGLLILSWTACYFCLWQGVKSTGKVVYVTATAPYFILFILFVYGITLPGSRKGLMFFLNPRWEVFGEYKMYFKAIQQVFFSQGMGFGGLITYGSYNPFRNNVHRDVIFISLMDTFTSIVSGFVVFSVLGNLATTMNVEIVDVVKDGSGLAFIMYPEALAKFWAPQLWTFLFFLMLFLLGIDSEFAFLEVGLTSICDLYPKTRDYKMYTSLLLCTFCFILGIPCVTQGGQYIMTLMDTYAGGVLVLNVIFQTIAIMWIYGINNFSRDVEMMLGFYPGQFMRWNLSIFSPILLVLLFILGVREQDVMSYGNKAFPAWSEALGMIIAIIIVSPVPGWAIYLLVKHRKDPLTPFLPTKDWGPSDPKLKSLVQERFYPSQKADQEHSRI